MINMSMPWLHACGISRQLKHFSCFYRTTFFSWLFQYFGTDASRVLQVAS